MQSSQVTVVLSGPVASLLLYEQTKTRHHQEGFLLGDVVENETRSITDNDQEQIKLTKKIKISAVVPCTRSEYLLDGTGAIDGDKLRRFLGDRIGKVVSWYKHQSFAPGRLTLRDRAVHEQLLDLFEVPSDIFTCCVLCSEVSENRSSHFFTHTFIRYHNYECDRIAIHIPNQSVPNNTYRHPEPVSENFSRLLAELKAAKLSTSGIAGINNIQNALQKQVGSRVCALSKQENDLLELEEEIRTLQVRRKLMQKNVRKEENEAPQENHLDSELPDNKEVYKKNKPRGRGRGKAAVKK